MITVQNLSLRFGTQKLFDDVNLTFSAGNCYGVIGANGAGKSSFLRLLSGDLEASAGQVFLAPHTRLSVLKQDHHRFNALPVLETVILGNEKLYNVMKEKDNLYLKEDFSNEDGIRAAELEGEFAEMGGWEAESEASILLSGLGIETSLQDLRLEELKDSDKVKVLLAQALFGKPDVLILDEPTNDLDLHAISWLEDFLADYEGTVLIVSHDRHFLNMVCTHICDVDFGQIRLYSGNYDFWYESCQLTERLMREQNKKNEEKVKILQDFIARFSANASKSRQATSRKKLLEKITVYDIPVSNRKYPYLAFKPEREPGNDILMVENLTHRIGDQVILNNINFRVEAGDKIAFTGSDIAITQLFRLLSGDEEVQEGIVKYGITISRSSFPKENGPYFDDVDLTLVDWLRQYSEETLDSYFRGMLGRLLFTSEEAFKKAKVLSGGERVRLMLARMMLQSSNFLLLDQPTNHLDLESITALNNGLMEFKHNILFACYDHQFCQTVANRILEITPNGIVDYRCSYDEYLSKKNLVFRRDA